MGLILNEVDIIIWPYQSRFFFTTFTKIYVKTVTGLLFLLINLKINIRQYKSNYLICLEAGMIFYQKKCQNVGFVNVLY